VESSCERGNEPSGSIKCWETTEWLHNLWPLEWCSDPQSLLLFSMLPKVLSLGYNDLYSVEIQVTFRRNIALLFVYLTQLSCLAYSWTLKMEAGYSSETCAECQQRYSSPHQRDGCLATGTRACLLSGTRLMMLNVDFTPVLMCYSSCFP
jgi:hypothetical protein